MIFRGYLAIITDITELYLLCVRRCAYTIAYTQCLSRVVFICVIHTDIYHHCSLNKGKKNMPGIWHQGFYHNNMQLSAQFSFKFIAISVLSVYLFYVYVYHNSHLTKQTLSGYVCCTVGWTVHKACVYLYGFAYFLFNGSANVRHSTVQKFIFVERMFIKLTMPACSVFIDCIDAIYDTDTYTYIL